MSIYQHEKRIRQAAGKIATDSATSTNSAANGTISTNITTAFADIAAAYCNYLDSPGTYRNQLLTNLKRLEAYLTNETIKRRN